MKKKLEIVAYQVKCGSARQLIAPELDGSCPALDFLRELKRDNAKGFQILDGQMRFLADAPKIIPREQFKRLDSATQLYEFRLRSGIRLYCCLFGDALVILTNGGKKNTPKEQNKDIKRAKQLSQDLREKLTKKAVIKLKKTQL